MLPILYKSDETDFLHNGLGVLKDAISVKAIEELNGLFELEIEYDPEGFLIDEIDYEMIVKAKVNDKQEEQLFRIYGFDKSLQNDNILIHCQHITYDAAGNFVESLELNNVTTAEAMQTLQSKLAYPSRIAFSSPNTTTRSSTKLYRTNPLQVVAGVDGSILDNWGGEIERDNFRVVMHARRGQDDEVLIAYKKNLQGLEAKFDMSNVVTRIFPFAVKDDVLITVPNKYIDSSNINSYETIKILPVDYSSDESVVDADSLYNASKNYFNSGGKDLPTVTMDVEFEPLWDTEEYKDLAVLELVGMGDTVTVRHTKMGIDVTAKVNRIEYDVIAQKNSAVGIGSVQAGLTDKVNKSANMENAVKQALNAANQAVTAANGKNRNYYGPNEPSGIFLEGDLWFRLVDDEYTQTYRFDGIQWKLIVDMDVNVAKQEAAEASERADDAYNRANEATENAQKAIEDAQTSFDKAQDALDTASAVNSIAVDAVNVANTAKQNAQAAVNKASLLESEVESISDDLIASGGKITTIEQNVDTINNSLSLTIRTLSDLDGVVSEQQTAITALDEKIELRATKTSVDTLTGRVSDTESNIMAMAGQISLMAKSDDVYTKAQMDDALDDKLAISTYTSKMAQIDLSISGITNRVSSTESSISGLNGEINTVKSNVASLDIKADSIVSSVAGLLSNSINLIPDGSFENEAWNLPSNCSFVESDLHAGTKCLKVTQGSGSYSPKNLYPLKFPVQVGTILKLSWWVKMDEGTSANSGNFKIRIARMDGSLIADLGVGGTVTSWTKKERTLTLPAGVDGISITFPVSVNEGTVYIDDIHVSDATEEIAVQSQISTIEQTVTSITTRVVNTEGDISTLQQTSSSFASRITNAEGDISTLTQTAQGLQNRVADAEGNITSVTQIATGLQSRMTSAEGSINTLTQTASSLTSTISSVQSGLDNLQIGVRNYVQNGYPNGSELWRFTRGNDVATSGINDGEFRISNNGSSWAQWQIYAESGATALKLLEAGKTYTLSFEAKILTSMTGNLSAQLRYDPNANNVLSLSVSANQMSNTKWTKFSVTGTISQSVIDSSNNIRVILGFGGGGSVLFRKIKLEEGSKATDWTPAPEDQATVSQFNQLSDAINLRVTKDDLMTQINLNPQGILIQGRNLILDGNTTVNGTFKVGNGNITSLDAGKITTGILDAAKVSVVNLNASNIKSGTLSAITINGTTIKGGTIEGSIVRSSNTSNFFDSNYTNRAEISTGMLTIESKGPLGQGEVEIANGRISIDGQPTSINVPDEYKKGSDYTWYGNGIINVENKLFVSAQKFAVGNMFGHAFEVFPDILNPRLYLDQDTFVISYDSTGKRVYSQGIYNRTYGNSANLFITSYGTIGRSTSATKYKVNISEVDLSDGYAERIFALKPKKWFDKASVEAYAESLTRITPEFDYEKEDIPYLEPIHGLIAEDLVDAGLEKYIVYEHNQDGTKEVEGIMYDRLWTLLIPISKRHDDDILTIKNDVDDIKNETSLLKEELEALREELEASKEKINYLEEKLAA